MRSKKAPASEGGRYKRKTTQEGGASPSPTKDSDLSELETGEEKEIEEIN